MEGIEFQKYQFEADAPHFSWELIRELRLGQHIIEVDQRLYNHFKKEFRSLLFFEGENSYALEFMGLAGGIVEFFRHDDRYYVRPARMLEN